MRVGEVPNPGDLESRIQTATANHAILRIKGFVDVPAFATNVTDRVGAGDSVLALSSLLVSQGVPWDIVGFISNVSGAQMVAEMGNRIMLNKVKMAKFIISLLK